MSHNLSNDAILGLDVDLPINESYNYSGTNEDFSLHDSQQGQPQVQSLKSKRKTDKLTPDLLTSNQGIFKILKRAKHFKFEKRTKVHRNYDLSYKTVRYSNGTKFGEDHHFKNLTKVLQMYQSWGHELRSHMKFDRFIDTIFKGFEDPYMKEWLRTQTREEMRTKMEKETLKEQQKIAHANSLARGNNASTEEVPPQIDLDMDKFHTDAKSNRVSDNEEEWSELFGGNKSNSNDNNNIESDADIDMSQIREKSHFSNYLRTSSQAIPFSSSQPDLTTNTNEIEENDEFDAIEGLQSIIEDEDNDKVNGESQSNIFSQYIAVGSQKVIPDSITGNPDENFADNAGPSNTGAHQEVFKIDENVESEAVEDTTTKDADEDNFSDDDDIDALLLTL